MIVEMRKAYAVSREADRIKLLRRLQRLGVLHIVPVRPEEADGDREDRDDRLRRLDAALQLLRAFEPRGPRPTLRPDDAVEETLTIGRKGEEGRARLDMLYREADRLRLWDGVQVEHLHALTQAGLPLHVLVVPDRALTQIRARLVRRLRSLPRGRTLVATIGLDEESLPARAEVLTAPERDRSAVLAEAAEIEKELDASRSRLSELAWLIPRLERERQWLEEEAEWNAVARSGFNEGPLYAVQGWVPAERTDALRRELTEPGLDAAVRVRDPEPDEVPPTLIRYRRWARPVDSLYRILRMVPGYREADASSVFMLALPLFAGMIIGDAGYGLLFALFPVLGGRRLARVVDPDLRAMVFVFGVAALVWGALTGVWFGLRPTQIVEVGGVVGGLGTALHSLQVMRGSDRETWMLLIKICFLVGATHLVVAHARRMLAWFPDSRAFAEAGWCIVLASMLGVIWILFFGPDGGLPEGLGALAGSGLAVGLVLVAGFSAPDPSPARRVGAGLAGSLLPLLGTFSDTLSYIRLMAVGLASYYLGSTFNVLAGQMSEISWVGAAIVLLLGHSLNIGLILIAIFAHGVRLNVLEFSSNAGIRWTGYPYRPFSDQLAKEAQP